MNAPQTSPDQAKFGFHVLLADDNEVNLLETEMALQKLGCTVTCVRTGDEAVKYFQDTPCSVLFIDCQMPEMDGYQATEIIREHERIKKLPRSYVVALTATVTDENRQQCYLAGMDSFLGKPLSMSDLEIVLKGINTYQEPVVLDPQALQELKKLDPSDNSSSAFIKLGIVFTRTSGQFILDFRGALRTGDVAKIKRMSHSFKSSAATMGAMELSRRLAALEAMCEPGMPIKTEVFQMVQEIDQIYPKVIASLNALMKVK